MNNPHLFGAYYAVRNGITTKTVGPCLRWQDACLLAFGVIDATHRVKCLGQKKPRALSEEEVGWFEPYIPKSEQRMTFNPELAMGPPEIAYRMAANATIIEKAENRESVTTAWQDAVPMLRFIPLEIAAKFSALYNKVMERFDVQPAGTHGSERAEEPVRDPNGLSQG